MRGKECDLKKKLEEYTVAGAEELKIQKTILAGKQLLLQNPTQELRWYKQLFNQLKYISPLLWIFQLLFFGVCLFMIYQIDNSTDVTWLLSTISFVVAFLGVIGFPEVCKSFSSQMWELEQSCKYNLRQIVTIKLSVIGSVDMLIVFILSVVAGLQTKSPVWELAVYFFVPFNFVCIATFFIMDFTRNQLSMPFVFCVSFGLAAILLLCINRFSLYENASILIWTMVCLVTFFVLIRKAVLFVKKMEQGGMAVCS